MRKLRKFEVLTLSTVLSFGILAPAVSATTLANEQQEQIQIRVAQAESVVTKRDLIEKFKKGFPDKFDFLNDNDFHMSSGITTLMMIPFVMT